MPSTYTAYAYYSIWFSDETDYDFAVSVAGGNLIDTAPRDAATLFGIPYPYPSGDMATIDKTITFNSGFYPGMQINNPTPSGVFLDDAVPFKVAPGQAGVPASSFPAGPALIMTWTGLILRMNAGAGEDPAPPNVMSQRRWLQGLELAPLGESGIGGSNAAMSRPASRTNGGHGHAVRGQNTNTTLQHAVADNRTGLVTATSWERFYFRLRTPGSATCGLWLTHGFPSAGAGAGIEVNTNGTLRVEMIDAIGTKIVVGTLAAPTLNTWYRFDIFLRYDNVGTNGRLVIYINGVLVFSYQDTTGIGLGGGTRHVSSELGRFTLATPDNLIEYDVDDWINADLPANVSPTTCAFIDTNYPFDWLVGSHVRSVLTTIASTTGWSPTNREVMNQGDGSNNVLFNLSQMTSTTSGAIMDGTTDHNNLQDEIAQKFGPVGAIIADNSANNSATHSQAGYALAGGANVLTTMALQTGSFGVHTTPYFPSGILLPPDIVPFHVVKKKSLDANQDITLALQAAIEYLGQWGPEDATDMPRVNTQDFLHNCRYTTELWGYLGGNTDGPVFTTGGTYAGNGTFQDINLSGPCHFLIIRNISGSGSAGVRFFGSSVGPTRGDTDQNMPNVRIWVDSTGQHKFTVSGVDVECNAAATNYQYIAFMDPGMRYNICGAFNYPNLGTSPRTNDISYINPNWLPEWGWVQSEIPSTASSTIGLSVKGPSGSAGVAGVTNRGVAVAQWGAFSAGSFSSRSGIHANTQAQINYSLWRKRDVACGYTMLQIFSYVGNGAGARVITFPDVTGRFPLFAHIQPANAVSVFRDPSHTAGNSSLGSTMAITAAGITAGAVDSITVASALNTNLINYDVFIILGSNASWANGTFYPPDCEGAYQPPPKPALPEIAVRAEGGLILGGTTAITLLKDISGIYTLVLDKTNDTLIDRQTGVASVDVKIPDPFFKTGYIGG